MASVFATNFAESAGPALLSQHGEQITVRPPFGASRTILAIVERSQPSPMDVPGAVVNELSILVLQRQTSDEDDGCGGIGQAEIVFNRLRVELAIREGQAPEARFVRRIIDQVGGMLRLGLAQ